VRFDLYAHAAVRAVRRGRRQRVASLALSSSGAGLIVVCGFAAPGAVFGSSCGARVAVLTRAARARRWSWACPRVERLYCWLMSTEIVFETHSWSEDNERGIATGWLPGRLSARGRAAAVQLGRRRRNDGIVAVFTSDLRRAVQTAELAFADTATPILHDWRLRECDYGDHNGTTAEDVHRHRRHYLDHPYPGGESWRQAVRRVGGFLNDLPIRWQDQRVLVIGHTATRWALDHLLKDVTLEDLIDSDFIWREGWRYRTRDNAIGTSGPDAS